MRRMKRTVRIVSLVLVLAMMLTLGTVFASAAETGADVYSLRPVRTTYSDCKVVAYKAGSTGTNNTEIFFDTKFVNGQTGASCVFLGVDIINLTFTASNTNDDYMVFMLKGEDGTASLDTVSEVPNGTNIAYINQVEGAENQSFNIYPAALEAGTTYNIYVSSKTHKIQKVGSLIVATSLKDADFDLGDVDGNGDINTADAIWVLKRYVDLIKDDGTIEKEKLAANTDASNADINTVDAIQILKYYVGLIKSF